MRETILEATGWFGKRYTSARCQTHLHTSTTHIAITRLRTKCLSRRSESQENLFFMWVQKILKYIILVSFLILHGIEIIDSIEYRFDERVVWSSFDPKLSISLK